MVEIFIYLLIAIVCAIVSRVLSGVDNGTFYAKGRWIETGGKETHPNPEELKKYILPFYANYHRIETPWWYTNYGMVFFFLMAFYRGTHYSILISIICAILITMGSSAAGNKDYQGYINVGSGLPYVDPNEKPNSEFAVGKYSKWWKRPFSGNKRLLAEVLGFISVGLGIAISIISFR